MQASKAHGPRIENHLKPDAVCTGAPSTRRRFQGGNDGTMTPRTDDPNGPALLCFLPVLSFKVFLAFSNHDKPDVNTGRHERCVVWPLLSLSILMGTGGGDNGAGNEDDSQEAGGVTGAGTSPSVDVTSPPVDTTSLSAPSPGV